MGLVVGVLGRVEEERIRDNVLVASIIDVSQADPHLVMYVFLPILVFESSFSIHVHTFKKVFLQVRGIRVWFWRERCPICFVRLFWIVFFLSTGAAASSCFLFVFFSFQQLILLIANSNSFCVLFLFQCLPFLLFFQIVLLASVGLLMNTALTGFLVQSSFFSEHWDTPTAMMVGSGESLGYLFPFVWHTDSLLSFAGDYPFSIVCFLMCAYVLLCSSPSSLSFFT